MDVTFQAPQHHTSGQTPADTTTFTVFEATLEADLREAISLHQRSLERNPDSKIQQEMKNECETMLGSLLEAETQSLTITRPSSFLHWRYSERIADAAFLSLCCGSCNRTLQADEVQYITWADEHAKGRSVICQCGHTLWLHFDTLPR